MNEVIRNRAELKLRNRQRQAADCQCLRIDHNVCTTVNEGSEPVGGWKAVEEADRQRNEDSQPALTRRQRRKLETAARAEPCKKRRRQQHNKPRVDGKR